MAKIYISSTYKDLTDHGRHVYDILRKMRYDVIAMEDYVAAGIHGLEPAFQLLESALDAGPIAEEHASDNELDGGARNA